MSELHKHLIQLDVDFGKHTSALIAALGKHWENQERMLNGQPPIYKEKSFLDLIDEFKIGEPDIRDAYYDLR
ncbi:MULTISPECIES: hypothetical protein [Leptospira]|uniref:Uncharacterized protein n=2 Tax=Leptospira weilii TaxID=28184 RepID=M3FGU6_9LEPT|nr:MULTISPECIES: hypothetical protein [Leptospira]EMF79677.1 hypothetical protein LEP1GSC188_1466 [Leptospira weilii serovar Topaz str. LT2116]EKR66288.1 hypothetical protein LEP1GSC036_3893 [Leptospira weilii str. 2006001853]EMJ66224.1 hypothetical protein LEP1GSC051_1250 [Leptospira sp. P2653]EMN44064.1 hypothetical protein LEP1GSC086_1080 [Leptospira weilii str. LNT 1234]QDK23852.1 hypothetical protein FHG67_14870 [Leptospira weilii]